MKLVRFEKLGKIKPGVLDKNNNIISTIETKGNSFIEYIDDRIKEIESENKG